jgi:hypothetical protein
MTVNFMPYVHDAARNVWTIPPTARDTGDDFELSMSNDNGADLLLALGITPEPNGGVLSIEAFGGRVTAALRRRLGRRSPERASFVDAEPGKMPVIYVGRREGYVEERLGDLARLVQHSRAAGATHIAWH